MKRCCVIGGAGFVGSHVTRLLEGKRQIIVLDKSPEPLLKSKMEVKYISGDYGDRELLKEILKDTDEVIHLAYSSVPKTSFDDPIHDITNNLPASVTLFDIASEVGVDKLIVISSGGTVYGKTDKIPICESHPTNPISPYGITKLAVEKYAMMYGALKSLPVVCVRPGNAFGQGQRPFIEQGFIATAIGCILQKQEVTIFGEKGTIRDYIHVSDIASGIISVLERGKINSCYNIGSGVGRSNMDILAMLEPLAKSAGLEVRVKFLPSRSFDVPANVLDSSKLREDTGWQIKGSFEEGLEKTWNWLCSEQDSIE